MVFDEIMRDLESCRARFASAIVQTSIEPSSNKTNISWKNYTKGIDKSAYPLMFQKLINNRQYSFLMETGDFFQFYFEFDKSAITKALLAFYPLPSGCWNGVPEAILEAGLDDAAMELTNDVSKDFLTFSHIRIDYDPDVKSHSKAHLQYSAVNDFRIPLNKVPAPSVFMDFILSNHDKLTKTHCSLSSKTGYDAMLSAGKKMAFSSALNGQIIHLTHN